MIGQTLTSLVAFGVFKKFLIHICKECSEFKIDELTEIVHRIPPESLGVYLAFMKAAKKRSVLTYQKLKDLSIGDQLLLFADYTDIVRAEVKHREENGFIEVKNSTVKS